jgi:putative hydrolase of HD superfamily
LKKAAPSATPAATQSANFGIMPQMHDEIKGLLHFFNECEKLKTELRHSWTSNVERQESVAEHTWMMCLLAITLHAKLSIKVNLLKTLKMIIVHDLVEVYAGDIPAFEKSERKDNKYESEKKAFNKLLGYLPSKKLADEYMNLWEEFEECKTPEAQFAVALDKAEVIIQHNKASISTWEQGDYDINPYYRDEKFNFDEFMRAFKDVVDIKTMEKVEKEGDMGRVSNDHKKRWDKSSSK